MQERKSQTRPLEVVIEAVCNVIPDDFPGKEGFVQSTNHTVARIPYTAPEQVSQKWGEFLLFVNAFLPDPTLPDSPDWVKTVAGIIGGKEDYAKHIPQKAGKLKASGLKPVPPKIK